MKSPGRRAPVLPPRLRGGQGGVLRAHQTGFVERPQPFPPRSRGGKSVMRRPTVPRPCYDRKTISTSLRRTTMSGKTTPKAKVGAGIVMAAVLLAALEVSAQPAGEPTAAQIEAFKTSVANGVEARRKLAQVINDTVFSFGELAYQEFETSKYLTDAPRRRTASRWSAASPACRPPGSRAGAPAIRSSRSAATSTAFRRPRRSRASPTGSRWSKARRAMARATIPARPSTSWRRSPSRS